MSTSLAAPVRDVPAAPFRLTLLGRFNLEQDGQLVRLRTRKEEGLLAYLVLHPGNHPREILTELYWGDTPEEQARGSLRGALADLRAALGPDVLYSDRVSVQFSPPMPFWVDVLEFEAQASRFLDDAAADPALFDPGIYTGELLEGHYDDWVLAERERFRQMYLDTLLRKVTRLRDIARYAEAITAAQQVLALDAAEERAHRHLIYLYAITGNRPAALRQLEVCRRKLREELDVEPSAETLALLDSITSAQQEGVTAAAATPGRGAMALPPLRRAELTNLPVPLTSFVGRERDLAAINDLMLAAGPHECGHRLVTLTGAGGSGKTRLAIQAARQLIPHFRDGAWWVELSSLQDPALLPETALAALGAAPAPGQPPLAALTMFLSERCLLLVLDNCEYLVEACGHLVVSILGSCPQVQVLATSREPLAVPGEQLWPVPTFAVPDPDEDLDAACLLGYDAVRLFVDRARMQRPTFELTNDNAAQVAEICSRLDGIPLAIELAAARVRMMGPDDILARLQGRLRLLVSGSAHGPPRHQTLRASIDWSYNLLSPAERLLLGRLAVFVGGCTLATAETVCAGGALARDEILDLLARLVDRSLVVAARGRYGFLETIREHALERLVDAGEAEVLRERHAAYFAAFLGERYDVILGAEQHRAIVEIADEIGNVRAAWAWAVAARRYDLIWRSIESLSWYCDLHNGFHEGAVMHGRAVAALEDDPGADRNLVAMLRTHHGYFLDRLGRLGEAHQELERGCAELRQADLPRELAIALTFRGTNAWQQGDYARARDLLHEGLAIAQKVSDDTLSALALFFLGLVELAMGNETQSDRHFREGLALGRALGQPRMISMILVHMPLTLLALGKFAEARERLEEGLAVARETKDRWLVGTALGHLGMVLLAQGDHEGARSALLEGLALAQETGSGWDRAWCQVTLGNVCLAERDAGQAGAHYRAALKIALEADAMPLALDALAGFAQLRALTGDREAALDLAEQVSVHPASTGIARARAAEVRRALDPGGDRHAVAPAAGAFEAIVAALVDAQRV